MTGTIIRTKLKSGRISWGYIFDAGRGENGKRRQVVRKGFKTKSEADAALQTAIRDHKRGYDIKKDPESSRRFISHGW